jgi:outer membrane protein OmpA-like peptidoglycan-associated protein
MSTHRFGQEKPVASNDPEDGRATNRRIELVVDQR